ncbi:MAG: twin-arginine translocase TatA/TatE family subunit [Gemmatimonadota bacterium]|nr:twin-arginine translocase TatA/TatE family subunit [Gemmatimonadota bacterium]MDH5758004.1 twin-arginine translocase TatA/TatE family subunit [Gemmatimonadota bacterium]
MTLMPTLALVTFGLSETLLMIGVLMLLFGAKKLPMLARGFGQGIRNFKGELKAPPDEEDDGADR